MFTALSQRIFITSIDFDKVNIWLANLQIEMVFFLHETFFFCPSGLLSFLIGLYFTSHGPTSRWNEILNLGILFLTQHELSPRRVSISITHLKINLADKTLTHSKHVEISFTPSLLSSHWPWRCLCQLRLYKGHSCPSRWMLMFCQHANDYKMSHMLNISMLTFGM